MLLNREKLPSHTGTQKNLDSHSPQLIQAAQSNESANESNITFSQPTEGRNYITGEAGLLITVTILNGHWTSEHAATLHAQYSRYKNKAVSWLLKVSEEPRGNGYVCVFFGSVKP